MSIKQEQIYDYLAKGGKPDTAMEAYLETDEGLDILKGYHVLYPLAPPVESEKRLLERMRSRSPFKTQLSQVNELAIAKQKKSKKNKDKIDIMMPIDYRNLAAAADTNYPKRHGNRDFGFCIIWLEELSRDKFCLRIRARRENQGKEVAVYLQDKKKSDDAIFLTKTPPLEEDKEILMKVKEPIDTFRFKNDENYKIGPPKKNTETEHGQ